MSLSTQTKIRLPKIKTGLRDGINYEQIGVNCGVTEKTIDRDMYAWVQSGEFEIWLKTEFVDLHGYARNTDKMKAYEVISKIVAKMITQRIERKAQLEVKQEVTFNMDGLSEDERNFARKLARDYIKRNDKARPASIH